MRSLLVCSIMTIGLSWAQHSMAAEKAAAEVGPRCETLDKLRAELSPKGARFTTLNSGQFHFLAGVYVAIPPVSGMPPADAALLVQIKKKNLVVWMKGTPSCASTEQPMQIGDAMVKVLRGINPGSGETSDADDSLDLHL